ncbi:hypothetical protein VB773_03495 [Haloarculaceae archaeon H-GB2-1]|nr:hypothetical protein [Haloarculaceae archaeon H-GB1-1]MEA5388679.1 hypothetical protein [Haloarculaceae archaeon H-GB11]MEA5406735.1 hypothetical protein [Haloarculaceae archaeon H-GB2-1]
MGISRIGLVVLLVGSLALASVPVGGATSATPQIEGVDSDAVVMRVGIQPNGTATWSLSYRVRLDDQNATDAFESLAADIEANETAFTDPFGDGMTRTAASAENATGREMAIRDVSIETTRESLPKEYGVVTYRFTWTGFAAVDGETLRAGDAIGGLFLDSETTLVLTWPDTYRLSGPASPEPTQQKATAVTWTGPLEFGSDEPSVTMAPATETTSGSATTSVGGGDGGGISTTALLGGLVALLVGVAGVGWYLRGSGDGGAVPSPDAESGAADEETTDDEPAEPPSELLSNEERVLKLLEDRGGRMKQQEVAAALDWTDAKTSQVISGLREDDELETFRLGRENVVTLPEEDPR